MLSLGVWTRDPSRFANSETIKAYEETVAKQSLPKYCIHFESFINVGLLFRDSVGEMSTQNLPGLEALDVPGIKEGQTKVLKNGNVTEAYQWSSGEARWIKVRKSLRKRVNQIIG
jgi:phospholipase A-2-activating protein